MAAVMASLQQGLGSMEHAAFVAGLDEQAGGMPEPVADA
jgi:hypothetical protein